MDPKKRNLLILVVIVIIIILLGLVSNWYLASQKQPSVTIQGPSPTSTVATPQGSSKSVFIPPNPSLRPREVVPAWQEGNTDTFSVQFPSTWSPHVSSVAGGGITAIFKPTPNNETQIFPRLEIEVSPQAASNPIADRIKTLAPLNFKIEQVEFQGIPATTLSGTLPFTMPDKNGIQNKVYKKFIFFLHNHSIYSINYAYYQDTQVPTNQEIFSIMLATLKLK